MEEKKGDTRSDNQRELQELPHVEKPFINPFIDVMFKKIFASETSKEVLRCFLNEILRGRRYIEFITYGKNEYPGDNKQEAKAIFDVICTDAQGATFLVEVQTLEQINFKERLLYYASRLISDQAPKGNKHWKYAINEVYMIALMEDFCLQDSDQSLYLHDICLCNRHTGKIFYNKLDFICIEMPKFVKRKDELVEPLDEWLYALKHAPEMEEEPTFLSAPQIDHFFDLARYSNFTEGERKMYRTAQQVRWDNENTLDFAKNKAEQHGLQKGLEQGLEQGRQEGIEIERAKAETEKREISLTMARKLKRNGVSIEFIADATGLTIPEIEALN
jgi:predicted transposase/invertase (TIGR01784 family)